MIRILIVDDETAFSDVLSKRLLRDLQNEYDLQIDRTTSVEAASELFTRANPPFDIVLTDNSLGPGKSGLAWLEELHSIVVDIDSILFTGLNEAIGRRAAEAGINRYITKPFEPEELLWSVRSIIKQRSTRFERQWLEKLHQIGVTLQNAMTTSEVSSKIVQGGIELGFGRVEFWRVIRSKRGQVLFVGCKQAGQEIPRFINFVMPYQESEHVRQAYDSREIKFFDGWQDGRGYLARKLKVENSPPSIGEWLCIPLLSDQKCTAVVVLQAPKQTTKLRSETKEMLKLFGQIISSAWTRSLFHENHLFEEMVNTIVKRVIEQTSFNGEPEALGKLLQVLYGEVNQITPTTNFVVALKHHDPEIDAKGWLRYAFHMKDGVILDPYWRPPSDMGLIRDFIAHDPEPCFCPVGTKTQRRRRQIRPPTRLATGWIATPLVVGQTAIGGIFIEEFEKRDAWSKSAFKLVSTVIQRLSPYIQSGWIIEQRARMAKQRELVQSANEKIMTLAQRQPEHINTDEWLWHATLTLATAHYGFSFNRAMLFLVDERSQMLHGRLGIGHLDVERAKAAWETELGQAIESYDDYLAQIASTEFDLTTPVYSVVCNLQFATTDLWGAFAEMLQKKKRLSVAKNSCRVCLPAQFVETFGEHDYWLLPALAGDQLLGIVVLDTFCETEPPQTHALQYIDTLTNEAAIISQTLKHSRAQRQLATLASETLTYESKNALLADSLKKIARTAHLIMEVDSVAIYPFVPNLIPLRIDRQDIIWYEDSRATPPTAPEELTVYMKHVLNYGRPLPIQDVKASSTGEISFAQDPVVQEKGVKSFIAVPIRGQRTGALRGLFYINCYWQREFTADELQFAQAFANITAIALRNWREQQGLRIEKDTKEEELRILMQILSQAVRPDVDEKSIVDTLLRQTRAFLFSHDFNATLNMSLFLRGWRRGGDDEPFEIRRQYYLSPNGVLDYDEHDRLEGLTWEVMKSGKPRRVADVTQEKTYRPRTIGAQANPIGQQTHSELDIPIVDEDSNTIGVLNVESSEYNYFKEVHEQMLMRLSRVAMMALDAVRRREFTRYLFEASEAITAPTTLSVTLDNIIKQAKKLLPNLSLMTVWHFDQSRSQHVLAAHTGLKQRSAQASEHPRDGGAVNEMLKTRIPLWAADVANHEVFKGSDFVRREDVQSTVAFPLMVEDELVGALFFAYRQHHHFSKIETELLPILAQFVAIGIHDAQSILAVDKERRRFKASLDITEAVGATPNLNQIFNSARNVLMRLYQHATVILLSYNRQQAQLEIVDNITAPYIPDHPDYVDKRSLELNETSMVGTFARQSLHSGEQHSGMVANADDVGEAPYLNLRSTAKTAVGATIMGANKELLGALVMEGDSPYLYDGDDVTLIASIATQIGLAIERSNQIAAIDFRNVLTDSMIWAADLAHDFNRETYQMRTWLAVLNDEDVFSKLGKQAIAEINLSFNRIAREGPWSGQQEAEITDLAQQIQEWIVEYSGEHLHKIQIVVKDKERQVSIYTNPGILKRIFRHLVSNGMKAMKYTGTFIIRVSEAHHDQKVRVLLEDSGTGIKPDDPLRSIIFEERVMSNGTKGGLGLLFVRLLAERIGGHVHLLDYVEGRGACFCLDLPLTLTNGGAKENEHGYA